MTLLLVPSNHSRVIRPRMTVLTEGQAALIAPLMRPGHATQITQTKTHIMTAKEARTLTKNIKDLGRTSKGEDEHERNHLSVMLYQAYAARIWDQLGFASWREYLTEGCDAENHAFNLYAWEVIPASPSRNIIEALRHHIETIESQGTVIPPEIGPLMSANFAAGYSAALTRIGTIQPPNIEAIEAIMETMSAELRALSWPEDYHQRKE